MNTQEIEKLSKIYLSDLDNRADYHAFMQDKDEKLLKKVVVAWAVAQGHGEVNADILALYIVNLALQNHPA